MTTRLALLTLLALTLTLAACSTRTPTPETVPAEAAGEDTSPALGIFESNTDVGATAKAGSATYDPATKTYRVSGGGENMWAVTDAFHFLWKKVSGDVTLTADVSFPSAGGNAHRKACLIIRQTLDPDSPYVDAALHGDGLTSLQFRETRGERTHEVQSNISAPRRLRLEKRGPCVSMSLATDGEDLRPAGGSTRLAFDGPFYVGLAVCAHDNNALEQAVFSNVELKVTDPAPPAPAASQSCPREISTLETITLASRGTYVTPDLTGGTPARITPLAPSYWHGWSPDSRRLAFVSHQLAR